jgi:hypothetical protein
MKIKTVALVDKEYTNMISMSYWSSRKKTDKLDYSEARVGGDAINFVNQI